MGAEAGPESGRRSPRSARARFLLEWLPVGLWAALIFGFSAQANLRFVSEDSIDFIVRKAGHMFVFGVLAALLWHALASAKVRWAIAWAWLGAAFYAATDEFHQSFTAGRHASPVDVAIDSTGALIGLAVAFLTLRALRRSSAGAGLIERFARR